MGTYQLGHCNHNHHSTSSLQAWSRSFVEMYSITHEWTIDNFIELDEEATVIFRINAVEGTNYGANASISSSSSSGSLPVPQNVGGVVGAVGGAVGGISPLGPLGGSPGTANYPVQVKNSSGIPPGTGDDLKFKLSLKPK